MLKYSIRLVHTPPLIMFTQGKSTYVRTWGSKNGEGVCSNWYISGIYGTNIHCVHMTRLCHLNSCCVLLNFFSCARTHMPHNWSCTHMSRVWFWSSKEGVQRCSGEGRGDAKVVHTQIHFPGYAVLHQCLPCHP